MNPQDRALTSVQECVRFYEMELNEADTQTLKGLLSKIEFTRDGKYVSTPAGREVAKFIEKHSRNELIQRRVGRKKK